MRRLLLIANPVASGFTAAMHRSVTRALTGPFDVTAAWPDAAAGARQMAAAAADDGFDVVAAMGGDGVAHQVANSLVGTGSALAVIPVGTTNVLARVLGIPHDAEQAAEAVASGTARPVPVARVTSDSTAGARDEIAMFAAGVGFDAEVVARAERDPLSKVTFGVLHYARSLASVLVRDFRHRLPTMRVTAGGRSADATSVLVQVHDLFTFVGRVPLRLGPGADRLTAAIVEHSSVPAVTRTLLRAASNRDLSRVRGIDVWEDVGRLVVEADPPAWFEADGELLGRARRIEVSADDRRLSVVVPRELAEQAAGEPPLGGE